MPARKFHVGQKVGRLTIIKDLHRDHANKLLVECSCDCGKVVTARLNNLGRKTNSCGCLKADLIKSNFGKPIEHLCAVHVRNSCLRHTPDSDLTHEDVHSLVFSSCFYCEGDTDRVGTTYRRAIDDGRSVKRIGIDRVNSDIGYYKTNVVACCAVCNRIKREHSVEDLSVRLVNFLKNIQKLR